MRKQDQDAPLVVVPKSTYRREIGMALTLKVFLLVVLWYFFFKADPNHPKPDRADLFAPVSVDTAKQE